MNPFIDKDGIVRANGRLALSNSLSYNERHPIILSYSSKLARLYIEYIHNISLHQLLLRLLRQEFWVPKAKNLIKTIIHHCKTCVIDRKRLQNQIMSALPPQRIEFTRPFTNTGTDFAGPFEIKSFTGRYTKITKGYVCIFVCFATKAIHLEAVSELSTPAFLAALARFIARRGCPNRIYSDNGRNFVGASNAIAKDLQLVLQNLEKNVTAKFASLNLSWHFIPPFTPHMGGLWEAGVKSFKKHFRKISGSMRYTFEELSTILARIESVLNSRPLTTQSDSISDLTALTPGHFLIGSALTAPAEPEEPISIQNRWRKLRVLQQEFCKRWKAEYLFELQRRHKWKKPFENVKVGDMVVIRNEFISPTEWRLGRIVKVFEGKDGNVRVAEINTQTGVITRAIHKLVVLPTSESNSSTTESS